MSTPLENKSVDMFYTYILQSKKDRDWYTGYTNDLRKRFRQHNSNEVLSTKGRGPFSLIYYEVCLNQHDAIAREKYLKSGMGKRYLKNRLKRFLSLTGSTPKLWKNKIGKLGKLLGMLCLISLILPNLADAKAVFITSGTTWTVPDDWTNSNIIEVIGGGGSGRNAASTAQGGGGGGGAYAGISNITTLTRGGSVTVQIGQGGAAPADNTNGNAGTDTFFNRTVGSADTCADTVSVCAKGGSGGTTSGGAGGLASGSVGTTKYGGGAGGTIGSSGSGGGGGAAGPDGVGAIGGAGAPAYFTGGGGGGNGGGTAGAAGASSLPSGGGGNNSRGFGGGAGRVNFLSNGIAGTKGGGGGGGGDTGNGATGGVGIEWDSQTPYGSGGGGGGAGDGGNGGAGALYGGGGGGAEGTSGAGANGIIVVNYAPEQSRIIRLRDVRLRDVRLR